MNVPEFIHSTFPCMLFHLTAFSFRIKFGPQHECCGPGRGKRPRIPPPRSCEPLKLNMTMNNHNHNHHNSQHPEPLPARCLRLARQREGIETLKKMRDDESDPAKKHRLDLLVGEAECIS